MFILVKPRRLKGPEQLAFDFQLVRSIRTDGKVRRKIIAHLGSERADLIGSNHPKAIVDRAKFYEQLRSALTERGVKPTDRLLAPVRRVFSEPSREDEKQAQRAVDADLKEWTAAALRAYRGR